MRVAYLTAGAGGMYCGSCMRDNTLAAALLRQGRDVTLIPVYSPIRTDEPDVSRGRVLYGGINIYLQQKSALFRRLPRRLARLLDHPALLRWAMRRAGAAPPETSAPLLLSILRGEDGAQRRELENLVACLHELRPQLVHLPNAFFVGLAGRIKRDLGIAVACTLTGEDIYLDKMPESYQAEACRWIAGAARDVDAFLAVSRYYADQAVARFGLPPDRVHPIPLGIRTAPDALDGTPEPASSQTTDRPFTIGYLARICPDKGLHVLCEAFARLHDRGRACRLVVAGYLDRSQQPYLEALRSQLARRGLDRFADWLGEVDRAGKLRMLQSIDVLSVPAVHREAKGIYVLEALAEGVPVALPRHGAFPERIDATGGGLLCEPNDPRALADLIERLMDDAALRRRLADRGREVVRTRFTDEIMASRAWEIFERCLR